MYCRISCGESTKPSVSGCGCSLCMCTYVTWFANSSSASLDGVSNIRNRTSNRDSSAAGRFMFSTGDILGLYRPYRGFAAADIDVATNAHAIAHLFCNTPDQKQE